MWSVYIVENYRVEKIMTPWNLWANEQIEKTEPEFSVLTEEKEEMKGIQETSKKYYTKYF